ncbi:MAG: hypothetical protein K9I68_09975 [Bacteroidales bacterium]|nr:hypothetical protein [Bacteroidales bacterium]MCF8336660.1 hypothetical protein [Bacteroidales bacterium]
MDYEELQRQISQVMHEQNNRSVPEFEGYSPAEMYQVLNFTFGPESPIQLQKLSDSDYKKIPILNQIKYLADIIAEKGELKLTAKGYLPTKIVADIYSQRFLTDDLIESGIAKLYKESDSMSINLTRILTEISGLAKKRKGILSLTKAGEKTISDNHKLLKLILNTFATKFNWAYYDGYGENQIGQLGSGFSLILLSIYGNKKRLDTFYADKYFKAFPALFEGESPTRFMTKKEHLGNCYSIRTFDRFLDYFGLINIEMSSKSWDADKYISKTDLFDKFIKCTPPKNK